MNCYWIPQSARVTLFTVSELLRKNQQVWGSKITLSPLHTPRLGLGESVGSLLVLLTIVHFLAKKLLKISAFPFKSVIYNYYYDKLVKYKVFFI